MLNISDNKIDKFIQSKNYKSFSLHLQPRTARTLLYWLSAFFIGIVVLMFIPWTQNIQTSGKIIPLLPDERPQSIHAVIPGRIEQWFVKEGDFVKAGDTILEISEIKESYFDPKLLERIKSQIDAKSSSQSSYNQKSQSLENQITSLNLALKNKIIQSENKVAQCELKVLTDSMEVIAVRTNYDIQVDQLKRTEQLYNQGLKSKNDLQNGQNKVQEATSKLASIQNKLLTSRNELANAMVELNNLTNEFGEKLAKAESDRFSALSSYYEADGEITKMENQYMNYSIRAGFYFITAPKSGYVTKAIRTGIGEIVKEGEPIITIMPLDFHIAVELYIKPMDLPLIRKDSTKVRMTFDGWPALIFSGWAGSSFGTFGGRVAAIDNTISDNGKYRILVVPDSADIKWPEQLRTGTGAQGIALLQDVPIWYELWRQLNGFPPDFYADFKEKSPYSKDKDTGKEGEEEKKKEEVKKK
jgi:multidrug resistance efflux pump